MLHAYVPQKSAEQAAYLHLLAKFHELGVLMEVIDRRSQFNQMNQKISQETRNEERDAIMDIYNYAARFDAVPSIQVQASNRMLRGRRMKILELSVDLSEQGIRVIGRGKDMEAAEIQAALAFKREAERYQAEHGNESLIIKDSTSLTLDSTDKFLDFLRIVRPGISIRTDSMLGSSAFGQRPTRVQVLINEQPVGEAVEMLTKKKAEKTAMLTACIALKKEDPELFPRYLQALQSGNGQILRPIAPIDMSVDDDCSIVMLETLLGARKAGLPDSVEEAENIDEQSEDRRHFARRQFSPAQGLLREKILNEKLTNYNQNPALAEIRQKRAELPMNQYAPKVLDLVNRNLYSIIVGATGSGKTTQVPQILLEEAIVKGNGATCNIICTQPRRIAATSVARRVAIERAEPLQDTVGYHVRFDSKVPRSGGSINYCTTGILLQQLQHSPDDILDGTSHLVIDEVHERDMLIDFLLILLKKNVLRRSALGKPNPQVVLMSATMDTELFADYFKTEVAGASTSCPALSVPGRTFPVREKYIDEILNEMAVAGTPMNAMQSDPNTKDYLEVEEKFRRENGGSSQPNGSDDSTNDKEDRSIIDWKQERRVSADGETIVVNEKENALVPFGLIASTISHITRTSSEGAILVFLPGLEEIVKVERELMKPNLGVNLADQSRFMLYKLHSSIPSSQTSVFEPVPKGCRKIILSTNIAETSVTIPDVQYVVDTGKLREKQYDQVRRITMLLCTWISKSNSKQRAGRAGRVQNGNYYALFSKERYDRLRAIGLPELLRADLQEICLDIKAQAFKMPIREFLAEAIEPPAPKAVDTSVINLQALDALTDDERITPLGRLLAALPVHPSLGKMIVLGIIFRCLDPMLILGAASAERSLFLNPIEQRTAAQASKLSFVEGTASDHVALLNAVRELRHRRDKQNEFYMRDFAHQNFLHINAFRTIDSTAHQIEQILVEAGLVPNTPPSQRQDSQLGAPRLNENSHKTPLIKALILSGFHPNLAVNTTGGRSFRTPGERNVIVHPGSINAPRDRKHEASLNPGTLYTYTTLAKSNDGKTIFLRDTTESTPLMAALFGGKLRRNPDRGNILELDNWLPFYVQSPDRRTAKTIVEFRKALERLLAIAFQELGSAARSRDVDGRFLADERVREMFAGGLVEVLDRDVGVGEGVRSRGWGSGRVDRGVERGERGRGVERGGERGLERSGVRGSERMDWRRRE